MQMDCGGRASLTVTGVSMLPMLRDRLDSVELVEVTGTLKKGDVILYRRGNGRFVLHRIVRAGAKNFICCGDNQWEPESVARGQVLAVVSRFTRAEKSYSVAHKGYKLYAWIWTGLFPVRRQLITMRRWMGRLRRKVRKSLG